MDINSAFSQMNSDKYYVDAGVHEEIAKHFFNCNISFDEYCNKFRITDLQLYCCIRVLIKSVDINKIKDYCNKNNIKYTNYSDLENSLEKCQSTKISGMRK